MAVRHVHQLPSLAPCPTLPPRKQIHDVSQEEALPGSRKNTNESRRTFRAEPNTAQAPGLPQPTL